MPHRGYSMVRFVIFSTISGGLVAAATRVGFANPLELDPVATITSYLFGGGVGSVVAAGLNFLDER